jgi:hypothetical protein
MVSMPNISDRRVRDSNGHMHVADCVITRGIVSDYLASELHGAVERGYKPLDKILIYRDPSELKKSLDSFKDIPLMRNHHVVSGGDPKKQHIIGTVSNPRMVGDDMVGDLTFWSEVDGIDLVLDEAIDNLSAGYDSEIDWTPGEHNGLHYVARFHTINANHVALVDRGRVPGARVADQNPSEPVMTEKSKFPKILAALAAVFSMKPEQQLIIDEALQAELGDKPAPVVTEPTEAEKAEAVRLAQEKQVADEAAAEEMIKGRIKTEVDAAVKEVHALYAAREAVSEKVGVTTCDSAEATYRFALEKSGVDHATIVADALPALWTATNKLKIHDSRSESTVDFSNAFSSHIRKG